MSQHNKLLKYQQQVFDTPPIDYQVFEDMYFDENLDIDDISGCYVFTVYDNNSQNEFDYFGVYVGQSKHVYHRVHDHINGRGNKHVWMQKELGKKVCVKVVPCHTDDLNTLEKFLIKCFDAQNSYNCTAGGAAVI